MAEDPKPLPIPGEIVARFLDAQRRVLGLGGRVSLNLDVFASEGKRPEWTVTIEAGTKPLTSQTQ